MKKVLTFFVSLIVFNNLFAQSVGGSVGGSITVCSGTNSGLLTLSGHTGNVVRWQSSTTAGASWSNISNTTTSLVFSNLTTTTWYRAEVLLTPSPPNIADYSTPAIITVDAASSAAVSSSVSVCSGSNNGVLSLTGTFTEVAGWDSSTNGGTNWIPIVNTTTNHSYSNLTTTTLYRATVTNGVCPSANASAATITVNPVSVGGSVLGTDTVCPGSNSGTLALTGHTGSIVRWQSSTDGGVNWSNITNTSSTHNFSNLTQTTSYRAVVQSGNCITANSIPVTIIVPEPSEGGSVSSDATVCSGTNTGLLELSGHIGTIIRWESSVNGGQNWTVIANTSDKYTYNNIIVNMLYRAVVQNGGCAQTNSTPASITVSAPSVGGSISGADTVCSGSNSGILTLSGYTGGVVRWQDSDDGGLSWSNIGSTTGATTYNYSNIAVTTNYRAVIQNGACPAVNSAQSTITVLPVSDGGILSPATYSACSGANNGTIALTGQSGNIIRWESSSDGGITWTQIANINPSYTFNNLLASTQFRALVQQGQCMAAYSSPSNITVYPATVGGTISGSDTVCTGTNNGSLVLNGQVGSILNWEYSKNGGVTWTNISNSTSIHNYTNLTATTTYRAVLQNGSCPSANSALATITVSPVTIGGNVQSSTTVCDSTTSGTLVLSGNTGSILYWQYSTDTGNTWITISNTANSQFYSGIITETMYKALVQSPACAIESSTSATISLALPVVASFTYYINGTSVIFTNTSSHNGGTNFWDFGDNTNSALADPAHTYIANGTYTVQLIISDSCDSDTTIQTINVSGSGLNEAYNNPHVNIYPNPFTSTAILTMNPLSDISVFKLFDLFGKEMKSVSIDRNTHHLQLDRGDLPTGIYFYKIQSSGQMIATGKIAIQ